MPDWLTETVLVQIVITAGVILGAGIPAYFGFRSKLAEIGKDAREARVQVKNSHSTNLREEQDERHEVVDRGVRAGRPSTAIVNSGK